MCGTYSSERRRRASKMHDVRSQAFSSDLIAKTRLQLGQQVISILVLDTKDNSYYSSWFAGVNDFIQRFWCVLTVNGEAKKEAIGWRKKGGPAWLSMWKLYCSACHTSTLAQKWFSPFYVNLQINKTSKKTIVKLKLFSRFSFILNISMCTYMMHAKFQPNRSAGFWSKFWKESLMVSRLFVTDCMLLDDIKSHFFKWRRNFPLLLLSLLSHVVSARSTAMAMPVWWWCF